MTDREEFDVYVLTGKSPLGRDIVEIAVVDKGLDPKYAPPFFYEVSLARLVDPKSFRPLLGQELAHHGLTLNADDAQWSEVPGVHGAHVRFGAWRPKRRES